MGTRARHLIEHVASVHNLRAAYRQARKAGRTRPGATTFDYDLESNLCALQHALVGGLYRPGPYRSFYVHVPKTRLISAAPFRDRVVHHAVVRVLEPLFERRFLHDSYACRKGKGTHAALERAHQFVRRHRYCLRADVVRFFPSVDHAVLMDHVARVVGCRATLALLHRILEGGAHVLRREAFPVLFPGDDLTALLRARGLPIGN
ncbi:MAG: reverse transcriptase domain-containing protein, partial [Planctomycetota bacterium]